MSYRSTLEASAEMRTEEWLRRHDPHYQRKGGSHPWLTVKQERLRRERSMGSLEKEVRKQRTA